MHMQNAEHDREGSRKISRLKEIFSWLRGYFSPKYIPQRIRYEDGDRNKLRRNPIQDLDPHNERSGQDN